jgi:hypothetical protein
METTFAIIISTALAAGLVLLLSVVMTRMAAIADPARERRAGGSRATRGVADHDGLAVHVRERVARGA